MTKAPRSPQSIQVAFAESKATPGGDAEPAGAEDCLQAYQRELNYLIGSIRRLGVPARDVEDVLHEVFLVMLRRWNDYQRDRPLRPWLFGIALRVAASQRRRGAREVTGEVADSPYLGQGPDEALALSEARQLLFAGLASVPLERRAVLLLHEVDEVSMRDVAEHLEIPLFTAYSRLRKARKELDAALARLKKDGPGGA